MTASDAPERVSRPMVSELESVVCIAAVMMGVGGRWWVVGGGGRVPWGKGELLGGRLRTAHGEKSDGEGPWGCTARERAKRGCRRRRIVELESVMRKK